MRSSCPEPAPRGVRRKILLRVLGLPALVLLLVWLIRPAAMPPDRPPEAAPPDKAATGALPRAMPRGVAAPLHPTASRLDRALSRLNQLDETELAGHLATQVADWPEATLSSDAAALYAVGQPDDAVRMLRQSLLRRWATENPPAAARWAQTLPPGEGRAEALEQVALAWAANDLAAAWEWGRQLAADDARDRAVMSLAYETVPTDPSFVLGSLDLLPGGVERQRLVEHSLAVWAETDPDAALAWIRQMPEASRQSAYAQVATTAAEKDSLAAADFVARDMEPGLIQQRAAAAVAQRWAQKDLPAALAWVGLFPDDPFKDNALAGIHQIVAAASPATGPRNGKVP